MPNQKQEKMENILQKVKGDCSETCGVMSIEQAHSDILALMLTEKEIYDIISLSCASQIKLLASNTVEKAIQDMKDLAQAIHKVQREKINGQHE